MGELLSMSASIRLGRKCLAATNAPAYSSKVFVTVVKCFTVEAERQRMELLCWRVVT